MPAGAAAVATTAAGARAAVWSAVSSDSSLVENGGSVARLMRTPLRPAERPDVVDREWHLLSRALLSFGDNWQVWTEWYQDILRGADHPDSRPVIEELEVARVRIAGDDWERGPARVNALIAELEAKYRPAPPEPDEIPQQDPAAIGFEETERRIDVDALAGRKALVTDDMARRLHTMARRFAIGLRAVLAQQVPGSNAPRTLADSVDWLIEATGETSAGVQPGLSANVPALSRRRHGCESRRGRRSSASGASMPDVLRCRVRA